jgi:hypothetical protein
VSFATNKAPSSNGVGDEEMMGYPVPAKSVALPNIFEKTVPGCRDHVRYKRNDVIELATGNKLG